jgi:hypothetical protein
MPKTPKTTRTRQSQPSKPTKTKVSANEQRERQRATGRTMDRGDQVARGGRRRAAASPGYARLRLRMEDGRLSIVDVQHVDSELVAPDVLLGQFAYEVTLGDRLLHADAVPDVGVSRSAPNPDPDAPPEQRGHHFTYYDTYEFDARVPLGELKRSNLADVHLRYFRVKGQLPPRRTDAPLAAQFEQELREVATIDGLPTSVLAR